MNISGKPISHSIDENAIPPSETKRQDQQLLEVAFERFNVVSGELIDAYRQLESQVNLLNAQLDEANHKLRRQFSANAELTERLRMLLEALPAGVIELSSSDLVLTENATAVQMLGQHVVGQTWSDVLSTLTPLTLDQTYLIKSRGCTECKQLTVQYKELQAFGGRIVLLQDVTRFNQLSAEFARQQKLAAMGSMAASLAHQLRTPLSTAMLYTANLRQENLKKKDRGRFIDKILARLNTLEGLIQNMLGFVRGRVTQWEPLDIGSVIEELQAVVLPQCLARTVDLHCIFLADPTRKINADRKALLSVLTNLLENALHFSPIGSAIFIRVSEMAGMLLLAVEDEGPGVAEANLDRLFEPFFTTRPGGTGLGLAIVKKVVEELGGNVSCFNQQDGGARFELTLPMLGHLEKS